MGKTLAAIIASLALALAAAPALAEGSNGCGGFTTQSVEADEPISTPVDTASTVKPESSG